MIKTYDALISHTETDCSINFVSERWVYSNLKESFSDNSKVTVEVKSRRKPRSLPQNGLFHAYCGIIADETGNSLDRVKSTLKGIYCKKPFKDKNGDEVYNPETGEVLTYIQNTADMDTIEMATLTEQTRMFALEWFGIVCPLPEEQIPFKFANQK
jgi:hypothetical protein